LISGQKGESSLFKLFEKIIRGVQSRLSLPYIRWFASYRFSGAVAQALAGFDVLYERFWWNGYGGLMASEKMGIPIVYEVNGDLVEEYNLLGIRLAKSQWTANHSITRRMFRRAARVVTVSETLRESTLKRWGLDPAKVTTVDNGAQVDLFVQPGNPERVRSKYGLNGQPLVIFVGSFKPWHGLDLLVESFSRLAQTHPTARLVFVGDGPVRTQLENQVHELSLGEKVLFTGSVPHTEVASLLDMAQIAVLNPRVSPASISQSPLKLFEYMAAGKAIVGPAIPNIQRLLTDRDNALLVQPDDPEALAGALSELLADPGLSIRLGQAAREQAIQRHSWDRTAAELENIFYQELGLC
jgi:glycosyltransferase involved in cell wall biosynthesis